VTHDHFENIRAQILALFETQDRTAAWEQVWQLVERQKDRETALAVLTVLEGHPPDTNFGLAMFENIFDAHENDDVVVAALADQLEYARDISFLNDAPPTSELFEKLIERLSAMRAAEGKDTDEKLLAALAHTARLMGRQHDVLAESCYRSLVALKSDKANNHYNYGLFLKTRGRFAEGVKANWTATQLAKTSHEAYQWNLGICATGAGQGEVALQVWKTMGNKIEMGRFELPEGRYPSCKVRLAERPLAERDSANDDPGLEETIWIERLSPCHGIIRSVLYYDLGVDYGDVVLIDGAPITYHRYGEDQIPVFPHLATLIRRRYQFFEFAGIQTEERQLSGITSELDQDSVIYSHTEQYHVLCATCWRDSDIDHDHQEKLTKHVVTGRIAVPPDVAPAQIMAQIKAAIAARPGSELYSPALCQAAGYEAQVTEDRRKFDLLTLNGTEQ